jgi:uncharacterized protein YrrD
MATMNISTGADVMGADGKLGEVERLIVDARTDQVTDLVIKHGTLFGKRRIVPLTHVTRVEDGCVYLDLDGKGFDTMDGYAEERLGPNPDYVGTPNMDLQGTHRGNQVFEETVAAGAMGGLGPVGKPMGYPGGEQLTPDFMQRPAIAPGMAVITADGEKVGEVGDVSIAADGGALTRVTLKRGMLFKHETELPLAWVRDLGSEGVLLNVLKAEVEALDEGSKRD